MLILRVIDHAGNRHFFLAEGLESPFIDDYGKLIINEKVEVEEWTKTLAVFALPYAYVYEMADKDAMGEELYNYIVNRAEKTRA